MTTAAVLDLIRSELLREAEQSLASADQRQPGNGSRPAGVLSGLCRLWWLSRSG